MGLGEGQAVSIQWASAAYLNALDFRIWEREHALAVSPLGAYSTPVYTPRFAVGDEVQSGTNTFGAGNFQGRCDNFIVRFLPASVDIAGLPYTIQPPTLTYDTAAAHAAAGFVGGWRRKRPREIVNSSATADTMSNAATDGQVAINLADGRFWKRVAGAWVLQTTGIAPDVLDSDAGTMPAGYCQGGDYIGDWIFDQINAICDLASASPRTVTQGGLSPYGVNGVDFYMYVVQSTDETDADWSTRVKQVTGGQRYWAYTSYIQPRTIPPTYPGFIGEKASAGGKYYQRAHNHIVRSAQLYVPARLFIGSSWDTTGVVYDDQGYGLIQDVFNLTESLPATAASHNLIFERDAEREPLNFSTNPLTPRMGFGTHGTGADEVCVVITWQFTT